MSRRARRALLALFCCLTLAACAARQPLPPADTGQVWSRYLSRQEALALRPVNITARASLWFTTPDRSNRTIVSLWGSLDYPLRADLNASMGAAVGLFYEDANGWIAYYPQSKEAAAHSAADGEGADPHALGEDMPFSLRDMGLLITGRVLPFSGVTPVSSTEASDGAVAYTLAGAEASRLVLDRSGRPLELSGGETAPWTVRFTDYDEDFGPDQAGVLEMTLPKKRSARVILKSIELGDTVWPASAMQLVIPPDVPVRPAQPAGH